MYVFFFAFKLTFSFLSQIIKTYNFVYSNFLIDQDLNEKVASGEKKTLFKSKRSNNINLESRCYQMIIFFILKYENSMTLKNQLLFIPTDLHQ